VMTEVQGLERTVPEKVCGMPYFALGIGDHEEREAVVPILRFAQDMAIGAVRMRLLGFQGEDHREYEVEDV
jgi:hypothetical protein